MRDDAILVVTVITDEDDQTSTGDPAGWYANLVASKGGNPLAIVMLGLLDDNDAAMPLCPPESPDPANLRALVDMFPTHIRGSVCEPSYNAFFEQAVELIAVACEQFDPA